MTSENSSKVKKALPEHLRVPWGVLEALIVFILPWVVLPYILYAELDILSPAVPLLKMFYDGLISNDAGANFIYVVFSAITNFLIIYLYLNKYSAGWSKVGWRKFNPVWAIGLVLLMLIVFSIGVFLLLALISLLDPAFNANQPQNNEFTDQVGIHPSIALLALVVFPPIVEETVFRGFIFPALSKKFGVIFGAVTSSILFGFAHLQANISIYTFVLGLVLCFMYVKLKSIFPGMALHMLNNYLAFIALAGK